MIYKIFYKKYKGKLLFKSKKPLSRLEAIDLLNSSKIYKCPKCNEYINFKHFILKGEHLDNGNIRNIYIPEHYKCCINGRVPYTKVIYKNKEHLYHDDRNVVAEEIYKDRYLRCDNCNDFMDVESIKRMTFSKSSKDYTDYNVKILNFDNAVIKYRLCSDCYETYKNENKKITSRLNGQSENSKKSAKKNNIKQVVNQIKFNNIDKLYNQEKQKISKIKHSYNKQLYTKLNNKFKSIGYDFSLYLDYLFNNFGIDERNNGNHHILPFAIFGEENNVYVQLNMIQHTYAHFLICLCVLRNKSREDINSNDVKLIRGYTIRWIFNRYQDFDKIQTNLYKKLFKY